MTNSTSIHQQVLALLNGTADYWDRPDCDWPGHASRQNRTDDEIALARQSANTAYVMGSLALERDNLDQARTWFARACDERHPGAAFRLAVLGLRQIGGLPATSREAGVAGVLTALCRAAEWGHTDAHRLIDPLITRTGARTGAIVLAGTSIVTSLPAMAVVPSQPYAPQDPWFYDEVLTFCSDIPAVSATADSTPAAARHALPYKASTSEARLLKCAPRSFAVPGVPQLSLTSVETEEWLYLDSGLLLLHWLGQDARLMREEPCLITKLLKRFAAEPPETMRSPQALRFAQCTRCEEVGSARLHASWAPRVCRQCDAPRGRVRHTDLAAVWETDRNSTAMRKPRHVVEGSPAMAPDVAEVRPLLPSKAPASTDGNAWVHDVAIALQVAGRLARTCGEEAAASAQDFWSIHTNRWPVLGCNTKVRLEDLVGACLVPTVVTPTSARGSKPARPAWAKLLNGTTLLSATPPRTVQSATHLVRNAETLYLFTPTRPHVQDASHQRLDTPIAITSVATDKPELSAPESEPRNQASKPISPHTSTPESIQVFALCP